MSNQLKFFALLIISIIIFFNLIFSNLGLLIMYSIIFLLFIGELSKRNSYSKLTYDVRIIIIFFLIWVFYSLIQLNYLFDHNEGKNYFFILLNGVIVIFFFSSIINTLKKMKLFYKIWGISLLIIILLGWIELFTGISIGNRGSRFVDVITVNYYNPNNYSFVLTVSLPVVLYWIRDKSLVSRILGFFMYVSSFYFIYVNQTRLSLILFILITVVYLAVLIRERKKAFFLFSLFIFLGVLFNIETLLDVFNKLQTLDSTDGSFIRRNALIEWALQIAFNNPLGVGPGQAKYYMPLFGYNLHNFWLEILANFGFVIFVGLVMFFFYFLYKVFKVRRKSRNLNSLLTPLFWVVIIFIPASNGPSTIFPIGFLWFILSMMFSTVNIISKMESYKR